MELTNFAYSAAFPTLLGGPAFSILAAWVISRQKLQIQRLLFKSLIGLLAAISLAYVFGVSTTSFKVNVVALCVLYFSFGILAVSLFRIRPKAIGIFAGIVASLPLLFGLLLGTIGVLAALFIVGDSVPVHIQPVAQNIRCYVYSFGNATTSEGGYDVTINRQVHLLEFLEYSVHKQRFTNFNDSVAIACQRAYESAHG